MAYNIEKAIISFIRLNVFWAEFSRHIHKRADESVQTACVRYNEVLDTLELAYAPSFMEKLSEREQVGVILHEFYHITLGHLTTRRRKPHNRWNEATDLAINSLIVEGRKNRNYDLQGDRDLPSGCLVPGQALDLTNVKPEYMEVAKRYSDIIKSLPVLQCSEWYFDKMLQEDPDRDADALEALSAFGSSINGGRGLSNENGTGVGGMDNHEFWDNIPDSERERIKSKMQAILEKATNYADSVADGWGDIPVHIQREIRAALSNRISWRQKLRRFNGYLNSGNRSNSIRRINKRYPYLYPGTKKGRMVKMLIAVDMSGSVSDQMLSDFSSEMSALSKLCTFDVLPFDCEVEQEAMFTWQRGKKLEIVRTRGGGTDFESVTRFVNDPVNRGKWDAVLILTDGEAPKPTPCHIKRGWVIGENQKLMFTADPEDEVIDMNDAPARDFIG